MHFVGAAVEGVEWRKTVPRCHCTPVQVQAVLLQLITRGFIILLALVPINNEEIT